MAAKRKVRLDLLLAERGLAESRSQAQRVILAGQVRVDGQRIDKAGAEIDAGAEIEVAPLAGRFASRGGEKLQSALERFAISPAGLVCLDLGASTGGFTDCLLQAGATRVVAVDVGRAQLHEKLRADPRVVSLEGVNARALTLAELPVAPAFAVADLSFISLLKIAGALAAILPPGAPWIALIKPQFEAGRAKVGRGGIVKDPGAHRECLEAVSSGIASHGFDCQGLIPSPIRGASGNREYLALFRRVASAGGQGAGASAEAIDTAIDESFA